MKKTIRDYDLNGKRVLIRCDFNVPMKDGVITDDYRIVSSLKTIQYAIDHHAKVILLSHLGHSLWASVEVDIDLFIMIWRTFN